MDTTDAEIMLLRYAFVSHQNALELLRTTDDMQFNEDFFGNKHCGIIYSVLKAMRDDGLTITIPAFTEYVIRTGAKIDRTFLANNFSGMEQHGRLEYYASIIRDAHLKRRIIEIARHSAAQIADGIEGDVVASDMHSDLCSLLTAPSSLTSDRAAEQVLEHWQNAQRGIRIGIPTPFERFNVRTGGPQRKLLTILCGRAGIGKSFVLAQWYHALGSGSMSNGVPIPAAAFVFEDGVERTMARVASIAGNFSAYERDIGNSSDLHIESARSALNTVRQYPIFYEERSMNVKQLRATLTRLKVDHNIQCAFVDGQKDLRDDHDRWDTNRVERYMSQHQCETAKMLDIALVAVHHITKIDPNVAITNNNIRGSGLIVADARMVIALQNSTDKNGNAFDFRFDLIKTNFTRTGCVKLNRVRNRGWFEQDQEQVPEQPDVAEPQEESACDAGQNEFPF